MDQATLDAKKKLYLKGNKAYNNDPNGKLVMTDAEFDKLEREIKKADPTWDGLRATGAKVNKKTEVKLTHFMPSLSKVYPEDLDKWRAKQKSKRWLWMQKLDGSALQAVYSKGRCQKLATRGDGTFGKDISFLIPFLNLPTIKERGTFVLRLEAVVARRVWLKRWRADFDNARQMANGLLNRRNEHPGMRDISMVVLGVYDKSVLAGLTWAAAQGFTVVKHAIIKIDDDFEALLAASREGAEFDLDGGVLAPPEAMFEYENADRPKWTAAFKVNDESGAIEAVVKSVIWQLSKVNRWTPKVEIEPTKLGAVVVTYATAHNAKWMTERGIGKGAVVKLVRGGDVIPKIVGVTKKAKIASVPPGDYQMEGVHYYAIGQHKEADVREIHHFMTVLGIEHLASKSIAKLYDTGTTSVYDHLNSYGQRMRGFLDAGIGKAMTAKIYGEFERVLHDEGVTLLKLMNASNCFESFGERKLAMIEQHFLKQGEADPLKAFVKMAPKTLMDERNWYTVTQIKGMGEASARQFFEGVVRFKEWFLPILKTKLIKINTPEVAKKKKVAKGELSGEFVSFTSYRNAEHEAAVEARGAEIIKYGAKTTILLYKKGGKVSNKIEAARAKGVKVCTFDEL